MPENSYAFSGLLKNARLRRYPAASPSRRRGNKLLLTRRNDTLLSKSNFKFSCRVVFASGALHCPAFRGIQGEAISFLRKAGLKNKRGVRFRVLTPLFRIGLDDR